MLLTVLSFPCMAMEKGMMTDSLATSSDISTSREYNMVMNARGHEFTGLCIMDVTLDGCIVGTIVNEFGVKAFDFTFQNGKAKVLNVMGPLNKWYIRKVLRGDFAFILANLDAKQNVAKKKRRMELREGGDIFVSNDRFKIQYTFTPMEDKE